MRTTSPFFLGMIVALAGLPLRSESIWVKYGNQVYRGAGDARSIALSEAEVASATGPTALLWNPARLQANEEKYITYAHQERFSGNVIYDIIGFDLKENFKSKWSLVLVREAIQGIPNTTKALLYDTGSLDAEYERILPEQVTYFNQVQWAGVLGISSVLGDWKIGGNAKILVHQLGKRRGYGIGFDAGLYRNLTPRNTVALAIRDATTSWVIWDEGTVERIAPQLHFGDVHVIPIIPDILEVKAMITAVVDFAGRTASDDLVLESMGMGGHLRAGLDVKYRRNLHLRFGRNPLTDYSLGLGLGFPFGNIDYAFTPSPFGTVLGTSHYISVNIKTRFLDSIRKKLSEEM
ncbi:MAG: hypothetical protein V3U24_09315 [Candidatus Neomarinimicrobiota bacterium]